MPTIKLVAGATSTFTSLMSTDLNTLVTGNAVLGSNSVANATNHDIYAEFSFTTGGSITPTGSPFVALYLYPLNGDTTTYGDGRFGTSAAGPPPSSYLRGVAGIPAAAGTQTGTFAIPGGGTLIRLPVIVRDPQTNMITGVTYTPPTMQ